MPRKKLTAADRIDTAFPRTQFRGKDHVAQVLAGVRGPHIDNIVSTCKIETTIPINVADIARRLVGKHQPVEFKADASIHLGPAHGSSTHLIFPSGRMVMTGVRCEGMVMAAAYRFVQYFTQKYQVNATVSRCIITNMHAVFHMGYPLNLEELHAVYGRASYWKDKIKCLVMKLHLIDPNTTTASPAAEDAPPPQTIFRHLFAHTGTTTTPASVEATPKKSGGVLGKRKEPPLRSEDEYADDEEEDTDEEEEGYEEEDDEFEFDGDLGCWVRRPSVAAPVSSSKKPKKVRGHSRRSVLSKAHVDKPVFTVSSMERKKAKKPKTATTSTIATGGGGGGGGPRKTKTMPTISFNVWPTGAVGVQGGRSRQHIELATRMAAEFLAQFTMHDSTRPS
jgi:TATA-box binding protein (TBP) (component of TFIID and TFIIIB)